MKTDSTSGMPQRRGTKLYVVGSAVAQICALIRYTLLARLLGPEQLGLAATLILTAQFFDSISDAGGDRFLIQDKDGDAPAAQKLVQLVYLGRGVFIAAALVLLSGPIASFYDTPALASGLMLLAISPLISGLQHLDMRRAQRHNDFRSEGLGLIVAESLSLVVTATMAYLIRDFTAAVYGLITRSIVLVIASHLQADRKYQAGYSHQHARKLTLFAAPLLANGLLLFIGGQSDRVLIGNSLGMTELGHYSAVLLLILYPSAMVQRYLTGVHLPTLSAARDDREERNRSDNVVAGQALLLALGMAAGFAVAAPTLIVLLYGPNFAQPALLVALIGILQCARFIRIWPTTVALAMGRSGIVLANNVARLVGLPMAIAATVLVGGLKSIVAGFIIGELVALATAIILVNRARGRPLGHDFGRFAAFVLATMTIIGWVVLIDMPSAPGFATLAVASLGLVAWIIRHERVALRQTLRLALRLLRKT